MIKIGYTMMTEQAGPRQLVEDLVGAERAGFDFSLACDHFFPWLDEQGHAGFTEAALVQGGGEAQRPFLGRAEKTPIPALREL